MLYRWMTGVDNAAFGSGALLANTTADNNSRLIGAGALDANTTGAANTAVGREALGANTTGDDNNKLEEMHFIQVQLAIVTLLVGRRLVIDTTGFNNVYVGDNAGTDTRNW